MIEIVAFTPNKKVVIIAFEPLTYTYWDTNTYINSNLVCNRDSNTVLNVSNSLKAISKVNRVLNTNKLNKLVIN